MEENKHCAGGPSGRSKCVCGAAPFLIGVAVALAFGWWVFPGLLFSKQSQPFFFSHAIHKEQKACADCHTLREDGSFGGFPKLETCMECHQDSLLTAEPDANATPAEVAAYKAEKTFVEEYVIPGKEVPWVAHQKQPDNVFFSHSAHFQKCYTCHLTMKGRLNLGTPADPEKLCMTCHPSLAELDKNIPVQKNMLTGYSSTTKKMWECEKCHANPGHFSNDGVELPQGADHSVAGKLRSVNPHVQKGRTAANNACYTCHK